MRGFSILIEEVLAFEVAPDARRILGRNGKFLWRFYPKIYHCIYIDITDCIKVKYTAFLQPLIASIPTTVLLKIGHKLKPATNTESTMISRAYFFRLYGGNQTKINEFKKPENKLSYNAQP